MVFQGYAGSSTALPVINARVNPLILCVWVGFIVLTLGIVCATWPKRGAAALRAAAAQPVAGDAA